MFVLVSGTVFIFKAPFLEPAHLKSRRYWRGVPARGKRPPAQQGIRSLLVGEIKDFVSALANKWTVDHKFNSRLHPPEHVPRMCFLSNSGWTFHHPKLIQMVDHGYHGESPKDYWFWIETSSTLDREKLDFMPRCWSVRTPRVSNLQIGTTASHDNCSTNPPMYMAPFFFRLYQTLISGFTSGATLTCHSLTQSISSQIHCTTPTCCESIAVGHEGTSRSLISAPLLW